MTLIWPGEKAGEDLMLVVTEEGRRGCFLCSKHWSDDFVKQHSKLKKFLYKDPNPSFINLHTEVSEVSGKLICVAVAGIVPQIHWLGNNFFFPVITEEVSFVHVPASGMLIIQLCFAEELSMHKRLTVNLDVWVQMSSWMDALNGHFKSVSLFPII